MNTDVPDSAIGRRAPALVLPRADGGEFSLETCVGRPMLVTFLSHAA